VVAATNRPDLLDSALIRMGRMDAIIPMLAQAKGDALGRWNILVALTKKLTLVLHPDLVKTKDEDGNGLGTLLHDTERIWTGAEMEAVLQSALQKAYRAARLIGTKADLRLWVDDFNGAMTAIIPRTSEVALQTDLALYFANNLDYCPEDWREAARDKKALKDSLADRGIDAGLTGKERRGRGDGESRNSNDEAVARQAHGDSLRQEGWSERERGGFYTQGRDVLRPFGQINGPQAAEGNGRDARAESTRETGQPVYRLQRDELATDDRGNAV
jgi:hypothetical protein